MVAGRTTEGRAVTGVGTTNAAAGLTAPAASFFASDVGRPITGTGIPAGRKILSVTSGTVATMDGNASATGTVTVQLGAHSEVSGSAGLQNASGFMGWSPETEVEAAVHTVLGGGGVPSPTKPTTPVTTAHPRRARG
jgi:hypothetical protein